MNVTTYTGDFASAGQVDSSWATIVNFGLGVVVGVEDGVEADVVGLVETDVEGALDPGTLLTELNGAEGNPAVEDGPESFAELDWLSVGEDVPLVAEVLVGCVGVGVGVGFGVPEPGAVTPAASVDDGVSASAADDADNVTPVLPATGGEPDPPDPKATAAIVLPSRATTAAARAVFVPRPARFQARFSSSGPAPDPSSAMPPNQSPPEPGSAAP